MPKNLKCFISKLNEKLDVICLQETFLKEKLDGYEIVRQDKSGARGGGVATSIRPGIGYTTVETKSENIEYIIVQINTAERKLYVSNV